MPATIHLLCKPSAFAAIVRVMPLPYDPHPPQRVASSIRWAVYLVKT